MKKLIAIALMLASSVASAQFDPDAGFRYSDVMNQNPGYIVSCPVGEGRQYTYWIGFPVGNNPTGRVAISRLGLPNKAQLFARVIDGERIAQDGYDLLIRTEVGMQYHVKFNGKKGILDDGKGEIRCTVAKTTFYS